jgi:hypothetical protein
MVEYLLRQCNGGVSMLVEMTRRESEQALAEQGKGGVSWRLVPSSRAHQWVRAGFNHETSLWIDDTGQIRRAK